MARNPSIERQPGSRLPRILLLCFYCLGAAGIITTLIVDFALNRVLTWSLLPISAIVYTWLCVAPL